MMETVGLTLILIVLGVWLVMIYLDNKEKD